MIKSLLVLAIAMIAHTNIDVMTQRRSVMFVFKHEDRAEFNLFLNFLRDSNRHAICTGGIRDVATVIRCDKTGQVVVSEFENNMDVTIASKIDVIESVWYEQTVR